jgi:carbamoyltransferase
LEALWHYHQTLAKPRLYQLTHAFHGIGYGDAEIAGAFRQAGLAHERLPEPDLVRQVARDLAAGKIVGWFQGRSEVGPRALGHRSILADPRDGSTLASSSVPGFVHLRRRSWKSA